MPSIQWLRDTPKLTAPTLSSDKSRRARRRAADFSVDKCRAVSQDFRLTCHLHYFLLHADAPKIGSVSPRLVVAGNVPPLCLHPSCDIRSDFERASRDYRDLVHILLRIWERTSQIARASPSGVIRAGRVASNLLLRCMLELQIGVCRGDRRRLGRSKRRKKPKAGEATPRIVLQCRRWRQCSKDRPPQSTQELRQASTTVARRV